MPRKRAPQPAGEPVYLSAYGRSLELTDAVLSLIRSHAPVAIGVSGGKDSCAVTFATAQVLDQLGHRGPRILIHSDLGEIEWEESLPVCRRLADAVGMELLVVRRRAGGLVARWEKRWTDNVRRYSELACVKLILPWSTAALRFCTSELKSAVICAALTARFRGRPILSVSGIRRDESRDRARAPIAAVQNRLVKPRFGTWGLDWHPIGGWTKEDVFDLLRDVRFPLHPAYMVHGCSRVSCAFCILASRADLSAAASVTSNHAVYRRLVALEIASTFPFRQDQWLGEIAEHLLDDGTRRALEGAKRSASERVAAEKLIPSHLLYIKGWPHFLPSVQEAALLADVRRRVSASVGITVRFTTGEAVRQRYRDLMLENMQTVTREPIAVQGDLLSSLSIAA
jgi:3'-phosphoadenosine 5'-phosphosulfate sulfotransferase (PAPS reductase)/FAD synthetase